jgi:hypothetical protein
VRRLYDKKTNTQTNAKNNNDIEISLHYVRSQYRIRWRRCSADFGGVGGCGGELSRYMATKIQFGTVQKHCTRV